MNERQWSLPHADWRALYAEAYGIFAWWTASAGLIILLPAVRLITGFGWRKCVIADVALASVSWLLQRATIFTAGILSMAIAVWIFGAREDAPVSWITMAVAMPIATTAIHAATLRLAFRVRIGRKQFWALYAANAFTLAVGIYGLVSYAHAHPVEAYHVPFGLGQVDCHTGL